MCGLSCAYGLENSAKLVAAMSSSLRHRGPDNSGHWSSEDCLVSLGHTRLSVIDLSDSAHQPLHDATGRWTLAFNGEIYNYRELRKELADYPFRTSSDTEVLLAAFATWGLRSLDRFVGMFAFLIWDNSERVLYAVRDRFGVKPLYYAQLGESFLFASEINALHAAGVPREPETGAWAAWLGSGRQDFPGHTFWRDIRPVPPGHVIRLAAGEARVTQWYSLAERVGFDIDDRDDGAVCEEYDALLRESVALRFRSDVPVAVSLSGGLDSAALLAMMNMTLGDTSNVAVYTYTSGDPTYDELPWVRRMLRDTHHPLTEVRLDAPEVPALADDMQRSCSEPYGGIPTLAYAKLCDRARQDGIVVLLGGEGMDEQWAGYDYYAHSGSQQVLQATRDSPLRVNCLEQDFLARAVAPTPAAALWEDALRNMQYHDLTASKIPRTMRYADRFSMRVGLEMREPFLDHRLVELAFRQPSHRKIRNGQQKFLLRKISSAYLPDSLLEPAKRPIQMPQREWLRGSLRDWCHDMVSVALAQYGSWLREEAVREELSRFERGESDNSYYVWQWISLGLNASVNPDLE